MKLISWNVNGLRASLSKGFLEFLSGSDADIFCLQETKMQEGQAEVPTDGYYQFWNSAIKKGYSGTAIFSRIEPLSARYGIRIDEHDTEGRVITLEYADFFLVNVYTPNSQRGLTRLEYRLTWENDFRKYIGELDSVKPVIICGDLNVAHEEIDIKNPKANAMNAGFTIEEREKLSELLSTGLLDSFRYLYPDKRDAYTWWSYMFNAREKNAGWRIDYFLVSERCAEKIKEAHIYSDVFGSDHCPIGLEIE